MATINGNNSDNILTGTALDDLIRGRRGEDTIDGGSGDDRLKGGRGEDDITDGQGMDRMWGGRDADTFRLTADGEFDQIRDWESIDTIDVSDWGVYDFNQLIFTEANGKVEITYGNEVLEVTGMGGSAIYASDFTAVHFELAAPPLPPGPPAQTIDFESLSVADPHYGAPIEAVDPGHSGFNWSQHFYFVEEDDLAAVNRTAGNGNRAGGGNVFATNGFGYDVDFSHTGNFDFEGFTAGAVYNDGMTLRVIGMDNGQFVGQELFTLNTTASTQIQLDDQIFDSVDQVVFQTYGGTQNPAYAIVAPDTTHAYFDDFMIA